MKNLRLFGLALILSTTFALAPSRAKPPALIPFFGQQVDRRILLKSAIPASLGMGVLFSSSLPAVSSTGAPTADELARIKQGYGQIKYLLDNFDQETTVCRENGGECKRDAEPIRKGK